MTWVPLLPRDRSWVRVVVPRVALVACWDLRMLILAISSAIRVWSSATVAAIPPPCVSMVLAEKDSASTRPMVMRESLRGDMGVLYRKLMGLYFYVCVQIQLFDTDTYFGV